jgi:hydrogenase maturation protease
MKNLLIIGYGNLLRRDDGAGRVLAEAVASWDLDGVAVRSIHQLVPELAEEMRQAACVVFVDAISEEGVKLYRLAPGATPVLPSHVCDPRSLLCLTRDLYGILPSAWLLAIPGTDFEMGEGLSSGAQASVVQALDMIRAFTRQEPPTGCAESAHPTGAKH